MRPAIRILDVDVDAVTLGEAVTMIGDAIDARRGHGGPTFQVATVNPEFLMRARRDAGFRRVLASASLRVADGAGLMLAARLLGTALPERVPGVELVEAVADAAAARGDAVFLLGAAPGVAESAAKRLLAANPALRVTGALAGSPDEASDAETMGAVRGAGADVVLVAYGAPAQEHWIARNLEVSGATVGIGVGGTFDYISGRVRRAPALMRRLGLEWLYRLVRQPWRLRRQLALPAFLVQVLRQRMRLRTA